MAAAHLVQVTGYTALPLAAQQAVAADYLMKAYFMLAEEAAGNYQAPAAVTLAGHGLDY